MQFHAVSLQDVRDTAQPDELIDFHHLKARRGMSQLELEDEVQTDLQRATGLADTSNADSTRLNRILQLTGMPLAVFQPCQLADLCCSNFTRSSGLTRSRVDLCPDAPAAVY